ncbi:AAA family ATPase [Mammaliicoccus sciuri]|uniref:AAA family ATPase n=1 Tax=Mammaliicoccus sciuri TaxID=1296 RepID=UPI001C3E792E|nr:AAA family ATPase [Mammaliicoccus sciuri]MBV5104853.1 AAA family ATPase [Mammaliicoccus sciuri]MEB5569200.1 AAA family ATPase [Mammaliicoccus sciuri]MEB5790315.1 AAA family ATPase [Mammaliicoccus sciuri]MEB7438050.1 AAA family ATPase [Mammaliicoccus sciuri]MEB7966093.1 AAA family ATPase [Mammaliicoccus sciuri]
MEEVKIYNLFGTYDVKLNLKNNYNMKIYVGENGIGKTTILNILHAILTGEVQKIINIDFEKIDVISNGKLYKFKKKDMLLSLNLNEVIKKMRALLRINLSYSVQKELVELAKKDDVVSFYNVLLDLKENEEISEKLYNRLISEIFYSNSEKENNNLLNENNWFLYLESLNVENKKVMYFPTFRRIEEELLNIDEEFNRRKAERDVLNFDYNNPSIKMMKSGMSDVETIIEKVEKKVEQNSINSFNKVTGDMMTYLLKEETASFLNSTDEEIIQNKSKIEVILSRISDEHFNDEIKDEILHKIQSENSKRSKSLIYFIGKLLKYYNKQEHLELQIVKFVETCNRYLVNKKMVYDPANMKIYIRNEIDNTVVKLNTLSSGEKQIVSIFTLVYLEFLDERLFILIDEPELSLSVLWQEKLIEDIYNSGNVDYLIAVTHSPFIYGELPDEVSENIELNYNIKLNEDS